MVRRPDYTVRARFCGLRFAGAGRRYAHWRAAPGRTVEKAARFFNLDELISTTAKQYLPPPSGRFETLEDLDGAAIAGPAGVIVEHVHAYQAVGIDHFVFDLRTRFDQYEECIEM